MMVLIQCTVLQYKFVYCVTVTNKSLLLLHLIVELVRYTTRKSQQVPKIEI